MGINEEALGVIGGEAVAKVRRRPEGKPAGQLTVKCVPENRNNSAKLR